MNQHDKNLVLERYVRGKEKALVKRYIDDGPTKMKAEMCVSAEEWEVIFDYLVFNEALLYQSVINSSEFFVEQYVKYGMAQINDIFEVNDDKYKGVLEVVFDYIAIEKEGLYYHVLEHREVYYRSLRKHGGTFFRRILGIDKKKYDEQWKKVLNILLKASVSNVFSVRSFDENLGAFGKIYNEMREHRRII